MTTQTGSMSALTMGFPLSSSSSDQSSPSLSSSDEESESTSAKSSGGPANTSQNSDKNPEFSFFRLKQSGSKRSDQIVPYLTSKKYNFPTGVTRLF